MLIKFWGVHGSLPRPGPSTLKYGGNTACVEVRSGNTLIIFDAGTGIRELGEDLKKRCSGASRSGAPLRAHIFVSHLHWDHVQGFPFFAPLYGKGNALHLYGGRNINGTIFKVISGHMAEPNFPVTLEEVPAVLTFHDLEPHEHVVVDDLTVLCDRLNHPGGSFGFRVEADGKTVVYASDTEYVSADDPAVKLAAGADLLIYDGMFTPEQYIGSHDNCCRKDWGHSTWEGAVEVARAAGVKHLILFHHGNEDSVVADIERSAKERFPSVTAAYEGLEIEI